MLELNLYSFSTQNYSRSHFELIVVDDGSADGTGPMCRNLNLSINIKLISNNQAQGEARACNQGAGLAEGELLIFCRGDTIQGPDFIQNHIDLQGGRDDLVLGSRPLFLNKCYSHYYDTLVKHQLDEFKSVHKHLPDNLESQAVMRVLEPGRLAAAPDWVQKHSLALADPNLDELYDWERSPAAWLTCDTLNVSMSRRLFTKAGGFDNGFHAYGVADWELGYRSQQMGAVFNCCKSVGNYLQVRPPAHNSRWEDWDRNLAYFYRKHNNPDLYLLESFFSQGLNKYIRVLNQYRELCENPRTAEIARTFQSLSKAFITRHFDNKAEEIAGLDMLSLRSKQVWMEANYPEIYRETVKLLDPYLPGDKIKLWHIFKPHNRFWGMIGPKPRAWHMHFSEPDFRRIDQYSRLDDDFDKTAGSDGETVHSMEVSYKLPNWLEVWTACIMPDGRAGSENSIDFDKYLPENCPPGGEILFPLLAWAKERVLELCNGRYSGIEPASRWQAELLLWQSLSEISRPCLNMQMAFFVRQESSIIRNGQAIHTAAELYRRFVCDCLQGGLQIIISDYPVWARLCATLVTQWLDAICGFLDASSGVSRMRQLNMELGPEYRSLLPLVEQTRFMRDGSKLKACSPIEAGFLQRIFDGDTLLFAAN